MIEEFLRRAAKWHGHFDRDHIDDLHVLTSNLLIAASSLTAFKAFHGQPLECLNPPNFADSWNSVSFVCI